MVSPENHGRSKAVLERQFAVKYAQKCAYNYAICIKEDNYPIRYVNVTTNHSHDLGYGLRKEFWHKGIAAEAGRAVVGQYSKRLGMEQANAACWFCQSCIHGFIEW